MHQNLALAQKPVGKSTGALLALKFDPGDRDHSARVAPDVKRGTEDLECVKPQLQGGKRQP